MSPTTIDRSRLCSAMLLALFLQLTTLSGQEMASSVYQQLNQSCSVEFFDTPLGDAVDELQHITGVKLLIDDSSLDALGLDASEPITFSSEAPLKQILTLMLSPLELDYRLDGAIVIIASVDAMPLQNRVYRLVGSNAEHADEFEPSGGSPHQSTRTQIMGLITTTISPSEWVDVGGEGAAMTFDEYLVVYQRPHVHRELVGLLTALELIEWQDGTPTVAQSPFGPSNAESLATHDDATPAEAGFCGKAEDADPGPGHNDPFGGMEAQQSTPRADNPVDDPFGGADPFGQAATDDPFGVPLISSRGSLRDPYVWTAERSTTIDGTTLQPAFVNRNLL